MRNALRTGQIVQSHFRARWTGEIVGIIKRMGYSDLAVVRLIHDKAGNGYRKQIVKVLDTGWLTLVRDPLADYYRSRLTSAPSVVG